MPADNAIVDRPLEPPLEGRRVLALAQRGRTKLGCFRQKKLSDAASCVRFLAQTLLETTRVRVELAGHAPNPS